MENLWIELYAKTVHILRPNHTKGALCGQFEVLFIHLQCLSLRVDQTKGIIHPKGDVFHIKPRAAWIKVLLKHDELIRY